MRTLRNTPLKRGDVVDTRSAVSGRSYGEPVIVTDARAGNERRVAEGGGYECRTATPAEVAQAQRENRIVTDIG